MTLVFTDRSVKKYISQNQGNSGLRIDSIKNSQGNIFNRYVPGAGVGATSISVRRAKSIHAAIRRR
jgi:hypothetical protein